VIYIIKSIWSFLKSYRYVGKSLPCVGVCQNVKMTRSTRTNPWWIQCYC
jgi:hypothetical protein